MKEYKKPMLYAETYTLVEHISQTCAFPVNYSDSRSCVIDDLGFVFFIESNTRCSREAGSFLSFFGIDWQSASFDDLTSKNVQCYNSFNEYGQLYGS